MVTLWSVMDLDITIGDTLDLVLTKEKLRLAWGHGRIYEIQCVT